jgi:hypothetical protein
MTFRRTSGRPPLAGRIDTRTAEIVRRLYLSGATMAEIGRAIGENDADVYHFVSPRRERWLRDNDFERRAIERGHLVVWKNHSFKTGGCVLRPITLPGTTIQRNMMAEAAR